MISVIVPVYNVEKYLNRCIDSILSQTYQDYEVILIDDGSTDESGSICDWYSQKQEKIKVCHKENGGLMSAWMKGVEESSGNYLCFVDSDDWIEKEMLYEMEKELSGTVKEIVVCNHSIDRENGERRLEKNGLFPGIYEGIKIENDMIPYILGNENRTVSFSRCMKLISKELITDNIIFCNTSLKMGEDVSIMLPALLDVQRIVIMKDAYFYHYYYNKASTVHKYDRNLYTNIQLLRQVMLNIVIKKFKNDNVKYMKLRVDMEYVFLLMLVLKNEVRGNKRKYIDEIKIVCKDEKNRSIIKDTSVTIQNRSNQLIYFVMKHPNVISILLLKAAVLVYDR